MIFLLIILFLHSLILLKLIFFPYPEFFIYPYLTNQGLIPYKEIFDQHFPGLLFLPINFNNLGMTTPFAARIWLISITLITQTLIYFIGKEIFKSQKKALFANLLFLVWQPFLEGWILWIDNFLPLFYLPAFFFSYKFLQDKRNLNLILTGFFLGLAVLFKQIALPLSFLLIIYLLTLKKRIKTLTYFLLGFLPLPLLTTLYFWSINALAEMYFWTIQFNLTTFAQYGRQGPTFAGLVRVIGVFSPMVLLPWIRGEKVTPLLVIFLIGSLAGVFDRFDFVHFQVALPFLALTAVLVFSKVWSNRVGKILICGYLICLVYWLTTFYRGHLSTQILFFDNHTIQISEKIKQLTMPKEEIFIFGPPAHLYQLSQTIPTGRIFVFQFPWFLRESEDKFLQALKKSPPKLIVRDRTVIIAGEKITVFASKLDNYIDKNYTVFDKIDTTEFLKQK